MAMDRAGESKRRCPFSWIPMPRTGLARSRFRLPRLRVRTGGSGILLRRLRLKLLNQVRVQRGVVILGQGRGKVNLLDVVVAQAEACQHCVQGLQFGLRVRRGDRGCCGGGCRRRHWSYLCGDRCGRVCRGWNLETRRYCRGGGLRGRGICRRWRYLLWGRNWCRLNCHCLTGEQSSGCRRQRRWTDFKKPCVLRRCGRGRILTGRSKCVLDCSPRGSVSCWARLRFGWGVLALGG